MITNFFEFSLLTFMQMKAVWHGLLYLRLLRHAPYNKK